MFPVVLPHLAKLALANNSQSAEAKRIDVATQLFEAYSALSCCCILLAAATQTELCRSNPGFDCLVTPAELTGRSFLLLFFFFCLFPSSQLNCERLPKVFHSKCAPLGDWRTALVAVSQRTFERRVPTLGNAAVCVSPG